MEIANKIYEELKNYEVYNVHRTAFCIAMEEYDCDEISAMDIANKVNGLMGQNRQKERVPIEFNERIETILNILKLYPETCSSTFTSFEKAIGNIKLVMKMCDIKTVEEFGKVIKYLEERNERDIYDREKDDPRYTANHIGVDSLFEDYCSYLKEYGDFIRDEIIPLYPKDVFDIVYHEGNCKSKYNKKNYYELNEEGYLVLKIKFI